MEPKIVRNQITIAAAVSRVWDALVNPEQTQKYMFGCRALSDWKPGSPLLWKGTYEGREMVFVQGAVLEINPPFLFRYSVIDPNSGMADLPRNYLRVSYELEELGNQTLLTVTQDGFEGADEGEKRFQDAYNKGEGWNPILAAIRELLESSGFSSPGS